MIIPIVTKNSTAKTSRNGSSRRRASAASGLSVTASPATNAASAKGTSKTTAPSPASPRPDATDTMRNRSCSERSRRRTRGSSQAPAIATPRNATMLRTARLMGRAPGLATARSSSERLTPVTSCSTDQPSSACSVERSVVRRRLRVMFTMTTLEDMATHRPTIEAARSGSPRAVIATATTRVVTTVCVGAAQSNPR